MWLKQHAEDSLAQAEQRECVERDSKEKHSFFPSSPLSFFRAKVFPCHDYPSSTVVGSLSGSFAKDRGRNIPIEVIPREEKEMSQIDTVPCLAARTTIQVQVDVEISTSFETGRVDPSSYGLLRVKSFVWKITNSMDEFL